MNFILILLFFLITDHSMANNQFNQSDESKAKRFLEASHLDELKDLKVYTNRKAPNGETLWSYSTYPEYIPDATLGYKNNPSIRNISINRTKNNLIFKSLYTTDQYSRRTYVENEHEPRKLFMIHYGCSFVFGIGLNDTETLPYLMDQYSSRYKSYNYGSGGIGPHIMLAHLKNEDFKKQLHQDQGLFIYHFIPSHIERANGFMHELGWLSETPAFYIEEEKLLTSGSFKESSPLKFYIYKLLREYFPLNFLEISNIPKINKSHLRLTCKIIEESKREFLIQFPTSKFIVAYHPFSESEMNKDLIKCLSEKGINVVKQEFNLKDNNYGIPNDGHPTAQFNSIYAKKLLLSLDKFTFDK